MALGTTPSVEGARERARAIWRALLYTIGCVVGGAAIAIIMTAAGTIGPRAAWLGAAGGGALVAIVLRRSSAAPARCWQVPKQWWRRLGDIAFVPAGATLTVGVFTPIIFPSFWILLLLFASLRPAEALPAGAIYGIARSFENWKRAFGRPSLSLDDPARVFIRRRQLAWRFVHAALAITAIVALTTLAVSAAS